jgi:hypothetical protein
MRNASFKTVALWAALALPAGPAGAARRPAPLKVEGSTPTVTGMTDAGYARRQEAEKALRAEADDIQRRVVDLQDLGTASRRDLSDEAKERLRDVQAKRVDAVAAIDSLAAASSPGDWSRLRAQAGDALEALRRAFRDLQTQMNRER